MRKKKPKNKYWKKKERAIPIGRESVKQRLKCQGKIGDKPSEATIELCYLKADNLTLLIIDGWCGEYAYTHTNTYIYKYTHIQYIHTNLPLNTFSRYISFVCWNFCWERVENNYDFPLRLFHTYINILLYIHAYISYIHIHKYTTIVCT